MPTLFDMLQNAQNGEAMNAMARQFGLSQQQTEAAMEALLPAFSQGLKRNAGDPYGVGSFLQALATGQHAQYFEDATRAFSPQGTSEGNGILGHLFGSKDLSRAVAAQAAQATGISQDVLKQMLPVLASMIMGGLFKQSTGQMQKAAATNNPLTEIIEQMMRQGGGTARAPRPEAPQPDANPFDNPLGKILEGMFGGGAGTSSRRQTPTPADNPFGKIFEEMLGGGQRQQAEPQPKQPQAQPRTNPSGRARSPYDDLFGEMFDSGARTRDQYQKSMESVFDQFLRGMDKHR
jgi:hypothetical protein